MLDTRRVQVIANRMGFYELVVYLEEHRKIRPRHLYRKDRGIVLEVLRSKTLFPESINQLCDFLMGGSEGDTVPDCERKAGSGDGLHYER